MTATEELRAMLDERGVEWRKTPHYSSESQDNETVFAGDEIEWYANDHLNGMLGLRAARYEVTPEQAIEATLGRKTCHLISAPQYGEGCQECSACGAVLDGYLFGGGRCPNCKAKVVDE